MSKLKKSSNKFIFGVCAGIAEYLGWDTSIVRLLFFLGTFATGTVLTIVQTGTGQLTIASSGTLNSNGNKLKLNGQFASCQIIVTASNTFLLIGNLAA